MAAGSYIYTGQNPSRGVAMVMAMVTAVVLSPLYVTRKSNDHHRYYFHETTTFGYWNSGFVLPVILGGLIIAIRTTSSSSSSSSSSMGRSASFFPSPEPSWVLRIGNSSWGLAGILVMLILVLSWQDSVQHFFWDRSQ